MPGQREEVIIQEETKLTLFLPGKLGKVAVVLLLHFSDLSAFYSVSESGLLILRPIRTQSTVAYASIK